MSRPSIPCAALRGLCLASILGLLGTMACHKRDSGKTLYLFDGDSKSVLVWNSVGEVYDAAKERKDLPKSDRQIQSDELKDMTLAWGGLALDPTTDTLYLVSTRGKVCVIPRASTAKGTLKRPNITTFKFARDADGGSDWVFGQAAVDPASNVLYVMATSRNSGAHRIYQASNASKTPSGTDTNFSGPDDQRACGLATGTGGRFYALFGKGEAIRENGGDARNGSRLRQGTRQGGTAKFQTTAGNEPTNLLMGGETQLPQLCRYGSLAYDDSHHELYVLTGTGSLTSPRILVFGESQFHGSFNQRPNRTLDGVPSQLRILAHPRTSNWLVGASFAPESRNGRTRDRDREEEDEAGDRVRREDGDWVGHPGDDGEGDPDQGSAAARGPARGGARGSSPAQPRAQAQPQVPDPGQEEDEGQAPARDRARDRVRDTSRRASSAPYRGQGDGKGRSTLTIWKSPNDGGSPVTTPNMPGLREIRGVAVGGN